MENTDLIYGLHAVVEALNGGLVNKLYVQEDLRGKNVEKVKELARTKKVNISWTPKTELNKLTENGVHQGFMARVSEFAYAELTTILDGLTDRSEATILLLDELTDPHNLGSIARTADATGVDAIIIPKHRAVGITPTAVKASTGALQHVPVVRVTNLSQALDKLKAAGFWIFGTDMDGTPYNQWNTSGKVALIIGNEGHGIGQNLKKQVDEMVTIPMTGHVQSLNASVAASILMYEIFKNRK
ncbi:23S rRNA (guanosine(2251)-2'-O)-methyltransferase RlmB [Lactococcus taiwanensis]|jgi:23S rRNA (guanosine2251-2'-O)-methyltransferase|uniref:23S rRNA (guanosine(2251)-2'-O)-methyltransferase RlmB n=1 Tax=Lactococcus taiwanensis TaxID=1151742 RepID=UPI0019641D5C|nr:23S rRNA (guanosine(2251)-2'-O)-methyltransferase RlmB [Lactococcus taiwanensis]QRZ11040.1 23S rRNA (guanosine(2251)-2'-O)-methyltransferase RlmB [Lactococcus taiwanensis]